MPAIPILPMAGLPSLTSSELYTQTLAAQADVLAAAQAWPLLTKSLSDSDLTGLPDRQQLAIAMGRSLTGLVFTQADLCNQVMAHPGNFPGYTLLQELEDIVHRDLKQIGHCTPCFPWAAPHIGPRHGIYLTRCSRSKERPKNTPSTQRRTTTRTLKHSSVI